MRLNLPRHASSFLQAAGMTDSVIILVMCDVQLQ